MNLYEKQRQAELADRRERALAACIERVRHFNGYEPCAPDDLDIAIDEVLKEKNA